MANQKLRPVRLDQFKEQLDDVGAGDLLPVNLAKDETVYIRLGFSLERDDQDEFLDRIQSSKTPDEAALVMLDYNPDEDAETALKRVHAAGHTSGTLMALFGSATADLRERVGNLRPRR
jgi:hypothetical protein